MMTICNINNDEALRGGRVSGWVAWTRWDLSQLGVNENFCLFVFVCCFLLLLSYHNVKICVPEKQQATFCETSEQQKITMNRNNNLKGKL